MVRKRNIKNTVGYQLKYIPKNREFIIELIRSKNIDINKVPDDPARFGCNVWVCRYKDKLEKYIDVVKDERVNNRRVVKL